jgi:hypothetical protein
VRRERKDVLIVALCQYFISFMLYTLFRVSALLRSGLYAFLFLGFDLFFLNTNRLEKILVSVKFLHNLHDLDFVELLLFAGNRPFLGIS